MPNEPERAGRSAQHESQVASDVVAETLFALELPWHRWWTIIPEIVVLTCTGALPILLTINVVGRYTAWYRVPWVDDVVRTLFLWIVFLGGAIAVKHGAHVRMAMLSDRFRGGRIGLAWELVIRHSPILMGAILMVLGVRIVEIHMLRVLPQFGIPAGYFSTVIPLSGALMIIYALPAWRPWRRDSG